MTYVFVDPSGDFEKGKGHTGIACMQDDDWNSLEISSIYAGSFRTRHDYWKAIIDKVTSYERTDNLRVIIESFVIRSNGFLIGKMPETIQLIGALVYQLEELGIQYSFQSPSQAKSRFKDELLPDYIPDLERRSNGFYYLKGKIINDHVRDALKHLLFYKRYSM